MKLLIDVGNTRIKAGWLAPDGGREPAPLVMAPDELPAALPAWLAALPPLRGALGSVVAAPGLQARLQQLVRAHSGIDIAWQVARPAALGLINGYREPHRLGADRWLSLVGLWAHPRHAAARRRGCVQVLATFGTATTIDTITPDGRFPGGLILPGVALMRSSLASGTARLPGARGDLMDYPDHTLAAIQTGILAAQWGAVTHQLRLAGWHHPSVPLRLVVGGGAWPELAAVARDAVAAMPGLDLEIVDNPVLDGLAALAAHAQNDSA
ncbi:MAG: type III pantothenate kinase [Pigmentiphaga sp.]|nr:type III pantothenate kinase [Pigmentiphaga sp.]